MMCCVSVIIYMLSLLCWQLLPRRWQPGHRSPQAWRLKPVKHKPGKPNLHQISVSP